MECRPSFQALLESGVPWHREFDWQIKSVPRKYSSLGGSEIWFCESCNRVLIDFLVGRRWGLKNRDYLPDTVEYDRIGAWIGSRESFPAATLWPTIIAWEIAVELVWAGIGKWLLDNDTARDWGYLVVFCVALVCVTAYLILRGRRTTQEPTPEGPTAKEQLSVPSSDLPQLIPGLEFYPTRPPFEDFRQRIIASSTQST